MTRDLHRAAAIFLLLILTLFVAVPVAQAAPGDFLFLWGAQQQFVNPAGVAVDESGNVYVTDTDRVQVFNSSGTRIRQWGSYGSGDGKFIYPQGIALDKNGRVYVVDTGNNRIQVFDTLGKFLGKWSHNWTGNTISGIAVDNPTNAVYVTDTGSFDGVLHQFVNDSIQVFDSQGNFLRNLGTRGSGSGEFSGPGGIATDAAGDVYVCDTGHSRILKYSPSGDFLKVATEGDSSVDGVAVDRNGNIYVPGSYGQFEFQVEIFDSAGKYTRELTFSEPTPVEHYWMPIAVAVDRVGNTYTVDADNDGLRVFNSAGNLLGQWWTYGTGDNQLSKPIGIAIDSVGNVYETGGFDDDAWIFNDRVRVFGADGKFIRKSVLEGIQTFELAVDEGGRVYLVEGPYDIPGGTRVHILDSSGKEIGSWESPLWVSPFGIALDKAGNVLVSDTSYSRVDIFDRNGNFIRNLGLAGTGSGEFTSPQGIAVDQGGNIFVVDNYQARIQMFNADYRFVRAWGSRGAGDGQFSRPVGIAVDATGKVFVADAGNNRIQVFDSSGTFLQKWGIEGYGNGELREPSGVAVNKAGTRVYVADTNNNRIQVFEGYGTAAPTFYISGTVRQGSVSGTVLPGATVAIAGRTATTYSNGSFKIVDIPPGSYTITISKPGFITKTVTGFVLAANRGGLLFYLTPAPSYYISGTVRQGSVTGAVLAGATVSLAGKTVKTYSNGSFKVTGIPAGSYRLTISKAGYTTKTITGYEVNSNKSGLNFYLTLVPTYYLSGTVRQRSATGAVLAGATVSIAGKTTTTYSNGSFKVSGIPAGTYTLTISKTGYATRTISGYAVNSNKSGLNFYLTLAPTYYLSGTVYQDQGTAPGVALPGVTVSIAGKTTTTYSNGSYKVSGIRAGTYTLTVSKTGFITRTISGLIVDSNKSGLVFYLVRAPG